VKRLILFSTLTLIFAGCAVPPPEPPAPPPLDPTGTYQISIQGDGMEIPGTLSITATETGYSGYIDTEIGGAGLADIVVDGNVMSFSVPEADVWIEVLFEGDGFSGTFDGAMGPGHISGVKRSQA